MAKQGPEAKLIRQMRDKAKAEYGDRLVIVKYHGSQFGEAGVSDFLCCIDGVFVTVEVKTPTGIVTPKQQAFGARVMNAGGLFAVCRTVEEFLETLGSAVSAVQGFPIFEDFEPNHDHTDD